MPAKHIFYIHSYITYLVALKVMAKEGLPDTDCIFLINREIRISEPIATYNIGHLCKDSAFLVTRHVLKSWRELRRADAFIAGITGGGEFYFYCPHTRLKIVRFFIAHPKCRGYSLLEEGLVSYLKREDVNRDTSPQTLTVKEKINRFLCHGNRIPVLAFFDGRYLKAYGVSDHSFPGYRDRVVLDNHFATGKGVPHQYDQARILVFDALTEFKMVTADQYLEALQSLVGYLKRNQVKEVFFKLHPEQLKANGSGERIRHELNAIADVEFIELPPETILEEIITLNTNITWYVFISSVALYAGLAGQKVYSVVKDLKEANETFAARLKKFPAVFLNYVTEI